MTLVLVVLFVVLPFAVAGGVIAFVSWRSKDDPPPTRTSDVLRAGHPGRGQILGVRQLGTILDVRPMVRVNLRVTPASGEPFVVDVTQSFPRAEARAFRIGQTVAVRVLDDRTAVAIEAAPEGRWPPEG